MTTKSTPLFDSVLMVQYGTKFYLFDGKFICGQCDIDISDEAYLLNDLKIFGKIRSINAGFANGRRRKVDLPQILGPDPSTDDITCLVGDLGYFTQDKPLYEALFDGNFSHTRVFGQYHPYDINPLWKKNNVEKESCLNRVNETFVFYFSFLEDKDICEVGISFSTLLSAERKSINSWVFLVDNEKILVEFF